MDPKYFKIVLIILSANILFSACSINKHDVLTKAKNGSYSYKIVKTSSQDLPVICATLYESGTNLPLIASRITLDGDKKQTFATNKTKIVFNVKPGTHTLDAFWLGYLDCETKNFNASIGDTLIFKFYLKIDTRPLTQPIVVPYKKKNSN